MNTAPQPLVVVLDACILISNVLRYLSLELARKGSYLPAWSPIIGDEWLRNASRLWEVPEAQLQLDWDAWQREFPIADQGAVQAFKAGLQYSDPKDWHVIAAARAAQQRFPSHQIGILSKNTKDFNRSELRRLQLQFFQPDFFFVQQCELLGEAEFLNMLQPMPAVVKAPDKPLLSVTELLKRERLFNLNKRYEQALSK